MGHEYTGLSLELSRPHDPWERFTRRNETIHSLEDTARFCLHSAPSDKVLKDCFAHKVPKLDESVPRRTQLLRDFFDEVFGPYSDSPQPWGAIVNGGALRNHVVLVDDRQNHPNCEKKIAKNCQACEIFSQNLTIPQLQDRLMQEVS